MRIAIDARLNAYRRGGIPQYTRHLLTALAEVNREDQFISLQHRDMLRPLAVAPNVDRRVLYTPPHHRFEPWTLPLELLPVRPAVTHFPDFIAPQRRGFPAVVTIHDLAFMHYPDILDEAAKQFYGQVSQSSARAEAIIAVSEATRQDIAQFLEVPIEQIDVVYEAAAPMFRPVDMREGEARVLNGTPVAADSFMLFVSTLEPRKNLPTLLQALRICIDRNPDVPYKLVVVGGRGWKDEPIYQAVRDLALADHVVFAGTVGQYDLRWLYNACRMYINPSLYEGFGLPLLEAMACGAACLASATSSLPEIGGDAAIYVPPLDPGMWAEAIEQLWDDEDRRAELGRLGRARAQRFSWLRAARDTMKIYQRVVSGAPRIAAAPVEDNRFPPETASPVYEVGRTSPRWSADSSRSCLRCGAQLVPGEFRGTIAIQPSGDQSETLTSRAWVCQNCGQVELVGEVTASDAHALSDGLAHYSSNGALTAGHQEQVAEEQEIAQGTSSVDTPAEVEAAPFDQPALDEPERQAEMPAQADALALGAQAEPAPLIQQQPETADPAPLEQSQALAEDAQPETFAEPEQLADQPPALIAAPADEDADSAMFAGASVPKHTVSDAELASVEHHESEHAHGANGRNGVTHIGHDSEMTVEHASQSTDDQPAQRRRQSRSRRRGK